VVTTSVRSVGARTTPVIVKWWRIKMEENVCKKCGEKLEKKEGDALYYCMKCREKHEVNPDGKS
jgi:ribosomal protein L37AE/L43A